MKNYQKVNVPAGEAVEKWDGKLPLSTGGNTLPFLKLQ